MSNVTPAGEEFTGYDYVDDVEPAGAEEGQTWYDHGANSAFVYDGAAWIDLSVSAHGELSNIGASDHHERYSDSEAVAAADGNVDANTVDGKHADEIGTPFEKVDEGTVYVSASGNKRINHGSLNGAGNEFFIAFSTEETATKGQRVTYLQRGSEVQWRNNGNEDANIHYKVFQVN